ncbi:hypothetical protein GW17_00020567 [Ensete ventricosum]|nr:hypothetical protein GW17_00020567 [Ensete ventricosum]
MIGVRVEHVSWRSTTLFFIRVASHVVVKAVEHVMILKDGSPSTHDPAIGFLADLHLPAQRNVGDVAHSVRTKPCCHLGYDIKPRHHGQCTSAPTRSLMGASSGAKQYTDVEALVEGEREDHKGPCAEKPRG